MPDYLRTILREQFEAALAMLRDCIEQCPEELWEEAETLEYLAICHEKLQATLSAETETTLQAPAGFARRKFSRGELYIYNLRHVQHHTGQLSARLRQLIPSYQSGDVLPWVGSGWR